MLVPHPDVRAAMSINSMTETALILLVASGGGLLLDRLGLVLGFVFSCLTYLVAAACLWAALHPLRLLQLGYHQAHDHQQADGQQQGGGEGAVRALQRFHDVDEDHRGLAEQLDQAVGGAFRGGLGDLGGVLHPDRAGADQEEAQGKGGDEQQPEEVANVSPTRPGMASTKPSSR